jgi:hypothetical protein
MKSLETILANLRRIRPALDSIIENLENLAIRES